MNRIAVFAALLFALTLLAPHVEPVSAQTPCGGATGPDIIVGTLSNATNYSPIGVGPTAWDALAIAGSCCNMGSQVVRFNALPANTHPVIGQNLFRYSTVNGAGRFEQVGQAWVKHAFGASADTTCCACQDPGTIALLGVGCSDPYSASENGTQGLLGPKYPINPHTGIFPGGTVIHPSGGNNGRLEVRVSDLVVTPGGPSAATRYFGQLQYISSDDSVVNNQNNNCSYAEMNTSVDNLGDWRIRRWGSTVEQFPALREWSQIDPAVVQSDLDVPEDDGRPARVILLGRATDLGNGTYHYEYAVYNMNSDRAIQSFGVPVSLYATITNVGFHDVDYRGGDGLGGVNCDGTDWPATVGGGAITWATQTYAANPNGNALRWGTLYNFRFDADVAPDPDNGIATMVQFKPGAATFTGATPVPSAVICNKADVNGDGLIDANDIDLFVNILMGSPATPNQKCAADATNDGAVDDADVDPFGDCLLNSGC